MAPKPLLKLTTAEGDLGQPVPPVTAHAISVSLPRWDHTVRYRGGEEEIAKALRTGYPRFSIHADIKKLAEICLSKIGLDDERCLLFPSERNAEICREFITRRSLNAAAPRIERFSVFPVRPPSKLNSQTITTSLIVHAVLFHSDFFPLGIQFWQHTGMGISSRMAERCLRMLNIGPVAPPALKQTSKGKLLKKGTNLHYATNSPFSKCFSSFSDEGFPEECMFHIEEQYGRNLPVRDAEVAKRLLRRRIAGLLLHDDKALGGDRPGPKVTESDIFLFPGGMTAIWNAHHLLLECPEFSTDGKGKGKCVCFGFPYTFTPKVLEKWGPGCHFFGYGNNKDFDELEILLAKQRDPDHSDPPILALFTELPSNPLLHSPDLLRLRRVADEYGFIIVIDETIGTYVNVSVLDCVDIMVTSLTKFFSGDANVMGGSLVLNPAGKHYSVLKRTIETLYEDNYFDEDVIFMERNSRTFESRMHIINKNAEAICDFLHSQRRQKGDIYSNGTHRVIKEVYYPKYTASRMNYDQFRRSSGGYGGLFSVTFMTEKASEAFFNALRCHKGPSLGTTFTLACAYAVLAHFGELEWAASFGVETGMVRLSVGCEDLEELLSAISDALRAAEETEI